MDKKENNILFTLLKIKSFLISMLNSVDEGNEDLSLTEEFLERKFPDDKEQIINILNEHGINCDSEIAFDNKIHLKFKEISDEFTGINSLEDILNEFEIETVDSKKDLLLNSIKEEREEKLKTVVNHLLKLAKAWTIHNNVEAEVDDLSKLTDEDLLRPSEEHDLENLSEKTADSFSTISLLTHQYLNYFAEYYFNYGGDIPLQEFVEELEEIKKSIAEKYKELFNKHGLNF